MDEAPVESTTPKPAGSLDESISHTNPQLREAYSERLELESTIGAGKVPEGDLRQFLLFEPFQELAPTMERECAQTRVDLPGVLGCFGTIVLVMASLAVVDFLSGRFGGDSPTEEWFVWAVLGVGAVGAGFTLWQLHLATRRWIEKRMIPHLDRALTPLKPRIEEIQEIVAELKYRGLKSAKHMRPASFGSVGSIDQATAASGNEALVPK